MPNRPFLYVQAHAFPASPGAESLQATLVESVTGKPAPDVMHGISSASIELRHTLVKAGGFAEAIDKGFEALGRDKRPAAFNDFVFPVSELWQRPALQLVEDEREHQISKGYDAVHDKGETHGQLIEASMCYAKVALAQGRDSSPLDEQQRLNVILTRDGPDWPWSDDMASFKPSQHRLTNLVKAAALLVAEIEREMSTGKKEEKA